MHVLKHMSELSIKSNQNPHTYRLPNPKMTAAGSKELSCPILSPFSSDSIFSLSDMNLSGLNDSGSGNMLESLVIPL